MTTRPDRPRPLLRCCLGGGIIRGDVYALDDEWARRYSHMRGRLACQRCALGDRWYWECERPGGGYVPGHLAARVPDAPACIDAWSHITGTYTQVAAVISFPELAVAQGAAEYMRWAATERRGTAPATRARLLECLADR